MDRPGMTGDQREIIVEMLANALRKDAHLRDRARQAERDPNPLTSAMARRRSEPSMRYIEGMLDIIRVLFPNGHALAQQCLEDAYTLTMGMRPNGANTDPDTPLH